MGFVPGCPIDDVGGYGPLAPIAVVLHRTYGQWAGDYAVIRSGKLCQVLIGKELGQWVQFGSTEQVHYHCNGANFRAFGIELTGTNDDPLTAWQEARLADVLAYARDAHGIPLDYLDPATVAPASVWVNGGGFRGVISHDSVRTDDGSAQHTDLVTEADYRNALAPTPALTIIPEEDDVLYMFAANGVDIWRMGDTRRPVRPPEWKALSIKFSIEHPGGVLHALPFDQQWWDDCPDVTTLVGGGTGGSGPDHFTGTVDLRAA